MTSLILLAAQLNRFGVHNGGAQDSSLLNEKWESLALMPVNPLASLLGANDEYYLFTLSDDDFITQDGYMNFGRFQYKDSSGYNLDNQVRTKYCSVDQMMSS